VRWDGFSDAVAELELRWIENKLRPRTYPCQFARLLCSMCRWLGNIRFERFESAVQTRTLAITVFGMAQVL